MPPGFRESIHWIGAAPFEYQRRHDVRVMEITLIKKIQQENLREPRNEKSPMGGSLTIGLLITIGQSMLMLTMS